MIYQEEDALQSRVYVFGKGDMINEQTKNDILQDIPDGISYCASVSALSKPENSKQRDGNSGRSGGKRITQAAPCDRCVDPGAGADEAAGGSAHGGGRNTFRLR